MGTFLNALRDEQNVAFTENGAVSLRTSGSECVDLFGTVGGLRNASEKEITDRFVKAYADDPDIAMKIMFYARDIRGGIGERRVFRIALKWLANAHPESVTRNIELVPEYGRWDDLLVLLDTACESAAIGLIKRQLSEDIAEYKKGEPISLLAKWLPSINASSSETKSNAKKIARALKLSDAEYRKLLSKLRRRLKLTENYLREKDYTFDYSAVPSRAGHVYREAFKRNDGERYRAYLESVQRGEAKMNTTTLFPYDIVAPYTAYRDKGVDQTLETEWANLEDFTDDKNALVVMDGSGSMYLDYGASVTPISVAMSLAIYYAEHNTGDFSGNFVTFSGHPRLVEVKGKTLYDKVQYCKRFNEIADTNIQAVFELILETALRNHTPQEEMPEALYIISDMEFNYCANDASITNFEYVKRLFESNGYKLPQVVFWNVSSRTSQVPVRVHETGTVLVSGCSPRIFKMLTTNTLDPYDFMMSVLNSERYRDIAA